MGLGGEVEAQLRSVCVQGNPAVASAVVDLEPLLVSDKALAEFQTLHLVASSLPQAQPFATASLP